MTFEKFLSLQEDINVIDSIYSKDNYIAINLSVEKTNELHLDLTNAQTFEDFIENYLASNQAKVAYGGYLEKRNLYKRSDVFNQSNVAERNIHIGLDLWIKAGTNVLAALDGQTHSFQNNTGLGDYGPTIILEHQLEEFSFYTLYGHLSLESLSKQEVGKIYKKGEVLAQLGVPSINGDYAPHLHFQIIKDLEGNFGDYPGVCAEKDLKFYQENCPDPNLLLKL